VFVSRERARITKIRGEVRTTMYVPKYVANKKISSDQLTKMVLRCSTAFFSTEFLFTGFNKQERPYRLLYVLCRICEL
jgi:hypothetical protein